MKWKKNFFLFFLTILLVGATMISFPVSGSLSGYVNQSSVINYWLTHFNNTNNIDHSERKESGLYNNIGINILKNATVNDFSFNISGNSFFNMTNLTYLVPESTGAGAITVNSSGSVYMLVEQNSAPRIVYEDSSGWVEEEITSNACSGFYSFGIDSNNVVHLACGDSTGSPDTIKYFNNTGGSWNSIIIDNVNDFSCSLAINSSDDVRFACNNGIFYYENSTGGFQNFTIGYGMNTNTPISLINHKDEDWLALINFTNDVTIFNRSPSYGNMINYTVINDANSYDLCLDFGINNSGHKWVAYYDSSNSRLKVSDSLNLNTWTTTNLKGMLCGDFDIAVDIDKLDRPHIVYAGPAQSISKSYYDNNVWKTDNLSTGSKSMGDLDLIFDDSGNGHVTWKLNTDGVKYHFISRFPQNITIDINDTIVFEKVGSFETSNITPNLNNEANDFLSSCSPNNDGFCSITLNINMNSSGNISISNPVINYTINYTNVLESFDWWNVTNGSRVGESSGILKRYKKVGSSSSVINITGFFIDSSATQCLINGVSSSVASIAGFQYCNLSSFEYISPSSDTWNNNSVLDLTLGNGVSVNQSNSSQVFNNTHRIIYFNVSSVYPNGSVSSSDDHLFNITAEINLTDNDLDSVHSQGISVLSGSTWNIINTDNICMNGFMSDESNYTSTTIGSFVWSACYNDTNNDGVKNYFKVLIPRLSTHELQAWGEEDIINPSVDINSPTGILSSTTANLIFNLSDNVGLDYCKYNITNDALEVETADTTFSCGNFTNTTVIGGGNDDYIVTVWANDTSGNINETTKTFSVSVSSPSSSPTSGGGGSITSQTIIDASKKVCNISISPENITFLRGDFVKKIDISNFEEFSITPSYTLNIERFELRGELKAILGESMNTLNVLRTYKGNESINETMIISFPECQNSNVIISYINSGKKFSFLNIFRSLEDALFKKVDILGLDTPFYLLTIVSILGTLTVMLASSANNRTKIISGTFIVLIANIFLSFLVTPVDVSAAKTDHLVDGLYNDSSSTINYLDNSMKLDVAKVPNTDKNVQVWWFFIPILILFAAVSTIIKRFKIWIKLPFVIVASLGMTLLIKIGIEYFGIT